MRHLVSLVLFFGILIVLMTIRKQISGFFGRGGGISDRAGGSAYDEMGFQDLNEADLIYESKKKEEEGFGHSQAVGGGGSGSAYQQFGFQDYKEGFGRGGTIDGHTAGESNIGDFGASAEFFSEQKEDEKDKIKEAFENIGPASAVVGKPETTDLSGPADATLNQPRKPYNLLEDLPAAPRGSISCLKASCCAETDFEWRTNQTGNFLQRTNNYKREFPDNCSAPLTELNLAFYKNALLPKA